MGNWCHVNLLNLINEVILTWPHDNGGLIYNVVLNHSKQETHYNETPLYLYSIQTWQLSSWFKCLHFVEKHFKNLQNPTQNHLLIKLTYLLGTQSFILRIITWKDISYAAIKIMERDEEGEGKTHVNYPTDIYHYNVIFKLHRVV